MPWSGRPTCRCARTPSGDGSTGRGTYRVTGRPAMTRPGIGITAANRSPGTARRSPSLSGRSGRASGSRHCWSGAARAGRSSRCLRRRREVQVTCAGALAGGDEPIAAGLRVLPSAPWRPVPAGPGRSGDWRWRPRPGALLGWPRRSWPTARVGSAGRFRRPAPASGGRWRRAGPRVDPAHDGLLLADDRVGSGLVGHQPHQLSGGRVAGGRGGPSRENCWSATSSSGRAGGCDLGLATLCSTPGRRAGAGVQQRQPVVPLGGLADDLEADEPPIDSPASRSGGGVGQDAAGDAAMAASWVVSATVMGRAATAPQVAR